jgi:hypothetical protein
MGGYRERGRGREAYDGSGWGKKREIGSRVTLSSGSKPSRMCVKFFHKVDYFFPIRWKGIAHLSFPRTCRFDKYLKLQVFNLTVLLERDLLYPM